MCGRYSLHGNPEALARQFGLDAMRGFAARYNIAPMSDALVVKPQGAAALLHWGFRKNVPNLRAETAAGRKRRCLVPASGFYEWKRERGYKQPYYVRPVGAKAGDEAAEELFALAGVYDDEGFAILTMPANELLRPIHERMPLIIPRDRYSSWFAGADGLVQPLPESAMRVHPVGAAVNRAANDSPQLIEPLPSGAPRPGGLFDAPLGD